MIPGEFLIAQAAIMPSSGQRRTAVVRVLNDSDWPVAVTSHFHFFEVNRRLRFDRAAAFGMHLDLLAGASIRWSPGELKTVDLIEYAGQRTIYGYNGFTNASLADPGTLERLRDDAVRKIRAAGYEDGEP